MNPVRIIEKKRDGGSHSEAEIRFIAHAAARLHEPAPPMAPEQLAAWLMAVVWRGMTLDETAALTVAMAESGDRVDLAGLPHPWVDKHSTGGVGDKTTLVLLPILAACGLTVVKMSGRGLGITGGTIDKLEAVPGFRTALTVPELKAQAAQIGLALTGQTPRLTPADKALYALRDVTGTVRSVPLIVASILSKKLAGGAEAVQIDLKCGTGAFMATLAEARELGRTMQEVAQRVGMKLGVTITDMSQPLGQCAGNALEVIEAIETLAGKGRVRFVELCSALAASTLELAGVADGRGKVEHALRSGEALDRARAWFVAQGADVGPDHIHRLKDAPVRVRVEAPHGGWVARVDARVVGETVVDLGGGRRLRTDRIDPRVGVETVVEIGDDVRAGRTLFEIHAATEDDARAAAQKLLGAVDIQAEPVAPVPVILEAL